MSINCQDSANKFKCNIALILLVVKLLVPAVFNLFILGVSALQENYCCRESTDGRAWKNQNIQQAPPGLEEKTEWRQQLCGMSVL